MEHKKAAREKNIMYELAKRFIGKDSIINLLDGSVDGVITEVTEGGIVITKSEKEQVVNLDYVMKIREYPYKNGKRATFIGD